MIKTLTLTSDLIQFFTSSYRSSFKKKKIAYVPWNSTTSGWLHHNGERELFDRPPKTSLTPFIGIASPSSTPTADLFFSDHETFISLRMVYKRRNIVGHLLRLAFLSLSTIALRSIPVATLYQRSIPLCWGRRFHCKDGPDLVWLVTHLKAPGLFPVFGAF